MEMFAPCPANHGILTSSSADGLCPSGRSVVGVVLSDDFQFRLPFPSPSVPRPWRHRASYITYSQPSGIFFPTSFSPAPRPILVTAPTTATDLCHPRTTKSAPTVAPATYFKASSPVICQDDSLPPPKALPGQPDARQHFRAPRSQ